MAKLPNSKSYPDPASPANLILPPSLSTKKRPALADDDDDDDNDAAYLPPRLSKRHNLGPPLGSPYVANASPEAATTTAEPETGRDTDFGLGAGQLEEEKEDLQGPSAWSNKDKDWDRKKDDDNDHMDLWRRMGELVLSLLKPKKEGILFNYV
ncbi:hypothetical protein LY76DRAFT_639544 [Colletotrichum caudatum]|nr:hypothetical protein LY76DRAFT_639544 [Colletotrichum caudatum]